MQGREHMHGGTQAHAWRSEDNSAESAPAFHLHMGHRSLGSLSKHLNLLSHLIGSQIGFLLPGSCKFPTQIFVLFLEPSQGTTF